MPSPYLSFKSNYDKCPKVSVKGFKTGIIKGYDAIVDLLTTHITPESHVILECYPGVDYEALHKHLFARLDDVEVICTDDYAYNADTLTNKFHDHLTNDRVFGVMSHYTIDKLYPSDAKAKINQACLDANRPVILYGFGASQFIKADTLIYLDMPRWEIQKRFRAGTLSNWKMTDYDEDILKRYKRGYFIEWRIADRLKQALLKKADYYLDTTAIHHPKCLNIQDYFTGLTQVVKQPFRLVPYFDPGVWGGQWMKEVCDLDPKEKNYAWAFDGVMEENSLYLAYGDDIIETPSINLVFFHPNELLGDHVHARFGTEFPIRFDFLDTMDGGNLSLQVHPLTEYIKETFGMAYTQDESYYILDAETDGKVYLGLKETIDKDEMIRQLRRAEAGEISFDAPRYINTFPAKKHDHFVIPAGTIHCSATNTMVLEISATPYIFTFKMWDWDRLGLDGKPRPIHLDHALKNICYERTTDWVKSNLVNRFETLEKSKDVHIERTGLHPTRQFIETLRHRSKGAVYHAPTGSVSVLNLVEGEEATVKSPTHAFEPFVVHYAETFIMPDAVGPFTVEGSGPSLHQYVTTIKAYVRR